MDTNLGKVVLVKDINPGFSKNYDYNSVYQYTYWIYPESSSPGGLVEFKNKLYFTADDGENGNELFVSDGTPEGTQLLVDLSPGANSNGYSNSSSPGGLVEFKDKLYFTADDGETGNELFVSDGTPEGTQLLVDLSPGANSNGYSNGSFPDNLVEFKDKLYFTADDGENGDELFVSDGTPEGTQLLVDLYPGANSYGYINSSAPDNLVEFNEKLYFTANDGESGRELFVSDGTAEGTQLLVDLRSSEEGRYGYLGSFPENLVEFNGKLYFTADDGENGNELFVSDGTAEGTQLLLDLYPGENNYGYKYGSNPSNLVEFNGKLYFTADDGVHGYELFVSDGTAEGTQLLVDLRSGENNGYNYGSIPNNLVEFNDQLYFVANDGENGNKLFVTDGTAEGTQLVVDIHPEKNNDGTYSYSSPYELTVVGDELFFRAGGEVGAELFKLTFDDSIDATPILINGSNGSDNLLGSDNVEQIQALGGQDTVTSFGGNDFIDGGDGDDRLISDTGDDHLFGGNGKDTLNSGNGCDTLWGGNDKDVLRGRGGNDELTGGSDSDLLDGGIGDDTLNGRNDKDVLRGRGGNDELTGGSDSDLLDGGIGNDTLDGRYGDDIFVLESDAGSDTIVDFRLGSDRLGLANGLQFDDLTFVGQTILAGEEVLATLNGINAEQLTSSDFKTI
jgi:ELWxxDGT repeat protein